MKSDAFATGGYLMAATIFICGFRASWGWLSSFKTPAHGKRNLQLLVQAATSTDDDNKLDSPLATDRFLFDTSDAHVIQAAAMVTQQSCELLGVKSIGVDYGLVKTGIASTVGYQPKPIAILSTTQLCHQILDIVKSEQATQIIVGLPLHKNGTEAEQTQLTRLFAHNLTLLVRQELGPHVPVLLWDERYTSKYAAALANSKQNPNNRQDLYGTLDADAACIILEHYYTLNGVGAQQVKLPEELEAECLQIYQIAREEKDSRLQQSMEQRMGGISKQRQQAMEQTRLLEAELEKQGLLGVSRKQKKSKKKREKRGPWLLPGA
jgi:putative holliday junction resolvase